MMAELMDNVVMQLITIVLAVSTLLGILDYVGFLPAKLKNWLKMNRSQDSLDILNRLGVDVDRLRRANQSVSFPKTLSETDIKQTVQQALDTTCRINHEVTVGHMRKTALTHYYDLIGKVCNPECASDFAGVLSTFWATQCQNPDVIRNVDFDFVVTPKSGCPLLGYEFAKLVKKPFVLREQEERFKGYSDPRSVFNCAEVPEKGSVALVVDDSTTGGNLLCNTVKDLRRHGYQVNTCLVVFEVKTKDARVRLQKENVQLVSIVDTHK